MQSALLHGVLNWSLFDPKQLPPNDFFDASADDDDEDDGVAIAQGVESILDIAQQIFAPMRSLGWHYRLT